MTGLYKGDHGGSWTEERTATARRLAAEGFSGSQIAAQLGGGVTRCAVVAKLSRYGIRLKGNVGAHAKTSEKIRTKLSAPAVAAAPGGNPIGPKLGEMFRRPKSQTDPTAIPFIDKTARAGEVGAVSLIELQADQCKWPIGDLSSDTFGFCGAPQGEREPYCDKHAKRAFVSVLKTPNQTMRSLRRYV